MPIASSVHQARAVVASLVLLGAGWLADDPRGHAVVAAGAMQPLAAPAPPCGERCAQLMPSRLPPPGGRFRALEISSMRVRSLELPTSFGLADAPPVRLAGRVLGAGPGTTVRLAIDAPEPGVWPGRVTGIEADGTFDFGPMRAGPYQLVAFDGDRMSPLTSVDTRSGRGDDIELVAGPCYPAHGSFWKTSERDSSDATPAAGVAIELSGWIVGVTDAAGAYEVCIPGELDHPKLRVSELADLPSEYRRDRYNHYLLWPEHLAAGLVLRADGSLAPNVGVQPIWRTGTDGTTCRGSSMVVTTDKDGRFTYSAANSLCGFRIVDGATMHDAAYDMLRFDAPQVIRLPAAGDERWLFDAH
jgi:hypothetical protein